MKKARKKGFTLIELLVVVTIIAILALIVLLALNPVEMARRSRDSRRLSDLGTLRRAIDLALSDKESLTATGGFVSINTTTPVTDFDGGGLNISKYLSVVPQDPAYDPVGGSMQIIAPGCTVGVTDKGSITYQYWSDGDTYILRANLESLDNCSAVQNDGNNNGTYEIGTDPGLDGV